MSAEQTEVTKGKVICPYCGTGCQIELTAEGNKIKIARGVKDNPINQGCLCLKGFYGWDYVGSRERLTTPMIRKKDGKFSKDGNLVPATWDEALDLVVSKMKEVWEKYGADAIAGNFSARCTHEDNYVAQKLLRIMGTNNIDHCARI